MIALIRLLPFAVLLMVLPVEASKCSRRPTNPTTELPTTTEVPSTTTEVPSSTPSTLTTTEEPSTITEKPSTTTEEPSTITEVPSTTTEKPSTTTVKPSTTTLQPTTTIKPANCMTRWGLLVPYKINATLTACTFTLSIQIAYNTWSASYQSSFNSYKNQIWDAVFNTTATHPQIFSQVIDSCNNFNKNNAVLRQPFLNVPIIDWAGTIGQFLSCGSNCNC